MKEVETIIYTEDKNRVSVSNFDEGVWLHLGFRHGTAHITLTREEAERLMDGIKNILDMQTV